MRIEIAEIEDAAGILEVQKLAYRSEAELYNFPEMTPMIETLEQLEEEFATNQILKAVENDRLIGSVRARRFDGECYVGRLSVHPDYQNRGIGRALMEEVERRQSDAKRFTLFTGSKSLKNIGLYKRLGYRTERREQIAAGVALLYMAKENSVDFGDRG